MLEKSSLKKLSRETGITIRNCKALDLAISAMIASDVMLGVTTTVPGVGFIYHQKLGKPTINFAPEISRVLRARAIEKRTINVKT